MGGRARASDVAARAGVSVATVSFVVNGKARGRVSEATQERVRAAVAELGYVANETARALATGRGHSIALLAHDMTNPFTAQVAAGVADALAGRASLVLALSTGDQAPAFTDATASTVDGVLLNWPGGATVATGTPVVHLDDPDAPGPGVCFDVEAGARALARHLLDLGHRRVRYLDAARPWATFTRRRTALTEELTRAGADVQAERCSIDLQVARELTLARWDTWRRDGVTAVVGATDIQTLGVLSGLTQLGVAVPGEVSLGSFDDIAFAAVAGPALTTVRLPAHELGRRAAELLGELIDGGPARGQVVLPVGLVVRESTGAPSTLLG
ncbi:hypothetical protein ASG36_07965 [Geodermatophilus sp. Leaf369]|uniref:LacI family DNA-binding transcriptional regulator n=1 Tax=Geodermatophilus sp. Leaf369 TaxID=1736354 RepID=UPI0006F7FB83|nr:LacI family DNA-binding transcriptional regulator [Geodermatophilus sp. Leaf369]KQS60791.1 hypothetical protein ASG36_07965 [Geodermatophilus sp. Leaf369]